MRVDIVTIFPEYLDPLRLSLVGRAIDGGIVELQVHDLREFTSDRHHSVDDTPFGGGPGMVMMPEPWGQAIDAILAAGTRQSRQRPATLVIPTPNGGRFDQSQAQSLAECEWIIFACGRYEGIDARVAQHYHDRLDVRELSIGDYVLAGGEAAVLVMGEAVIRLLPGVLGNVQSAGDDSFSPNRTGAALEAPAYTKPVRWRDLDVPPILLSGHHGAITKWRDEQSEERTRSFRPDLLS
jgi:tRNA (guanine37-N1)-methyltransferase